MDNPIQNETEIEERKHAESFASTGRPETSEGTSVSMKDPDTVLSITVLLLACLALAVLAHVFV